MPQLRHKHKGTRRKIGRKRFPNKSIKIEERAYKQVRVIEDNLPKEAPTLSIVLDIGIERVSELIRGITKDNEDAFQDAWEAILSDHVTTEDDVARISREICHRYNTEAIAKEHQEASLDEPIGEHQEEQTFTLKSIIPTQESAELAYPPKFHHQSLNPQEVTLDKDTREILKRKFPNLSYRDAIRQLVGLPLAAKKRPLWQPEEDAVIRKVYSWGGTMAVHLELPGRDVNGIRARAKKLGCQFDTLRPKAEWLTTTQVANILGTHNKRVCDLTHNGKLTPISLKYQGGVQFQFQPNEITKFIRTQVWEYHAEAISKPYQEYIPESRKVWVAVGEAARQAECHTNTILAYKKLGILEFHVASPYQLLVKVDDVLRAKKLAKVRRTVSLQNRERVCKWCGAHDFLKYGHRGGAQRWRCAICHRIACFNGKGYKMKTPQYIIDKAMELREANATYAMITQELCKLYGVHVAKACLSRWCDKYGIGPSVSSPYLSRDKGALIEKLTTHFSQGTSYATDHILATCGYSPKTKLESTQLLKYNLIIRRNGGYAVNDKFYIPKVA